MYKVIVVDDEPASVNYIKNIIDKKNMEFEVVDTAVNGEEALRKIKKHIPDVVISDIRMPILDGLGLVEKASKEFSRTYFIIVSGYQEFEYAKKAIKYGVCEYLLKPIKPAKLVETLEGIGQKVRANYFDMQKKILSHMCSNAYEKGTGDLALYFSEQKYYCGIIRRNGMPSQFISDKNYEVFSLDGEQIHVYGRDEMELMYLLPEKVMLGNKSIGEVMKSFFFKEINENTYVTCIYNNESFGIADFPVVVQKIYKKLNETITVGENQIVRLKDKVQKEEAVLVRENEIIESINFLIKNNEVSKLRAGFEELFRIWKKYKFGQLDIERKLYLIMQRLKNKMKFNATIFEFEYEINDLFLYATSMEEILENIIEKIEAVYPDENVGDENKELYLSILAYLTYNMEKALSLTLVCRHFGISQTMLSKWFREFGHTSFNRYLTNIRIEKAKELLLAYPEMYIKDISKMVGYSDQFYFSRIFRTIVGVSPSDYINK